MSALVLAAAVVLPLATPASAADVTYEQRYGVERYRAPAPVYVAPPVYAPPVLFERSPTPVPVYPSPRVYVSPVYVEPYVEVSPYYILPRYPRPQGYVYPPNLLRFGPYGRVVEIEHRPYPPAPINPPRGALSYYPPELDAIEQVPVPYGWSYAR